MRNIHRAYTLWVGGTDYGYEIEEVGVVLPDETYVDHKYGGAFMTAEIPMAMVEKLCPTFKMANHSPEMLGRLNAPLGTTEIFTFRSALVDEVGGATRPEVLVYEGRLAGPSMDGFSRGEKAGIEFTIKGVRYFRMEIGGASLHEVSLEPGFYRVNGVDR
ncbi:MAG: phage major tail tube protein, partial [Myxococcota bacterium]